MKVSLPDSNQLWLEDGTNMKHGGNFVTNRHIVLKKDDTYFDVKPDTNYPFSVKTPQLSIQVMGTSLL